MATLKRVPAGMHGAGRFARHERGDDPRVSLHRQHDQDIAVATGIDLGSGLNDYSSDDIRAAYEAGFEAGRAAG